VEDWKNEGEKTPQTLVKINSCIIASEKDYQILHPVKGSTCSTENKTKQPRNLRNKSTHSFNWLCLNLLLFTLSTNSYSSNICLYVCWLLNYESVLKKKDHRHQIIQRSITRRKRVYTAGQLKVTNSPFWLKADKPYEKNQTCIHKANHWCGWSKILNNFYKHETNKYPTQETNQGRKFG